MRRASSSVTGTTPEILPAFFPSPGPSSVSPAPLTAGTLWLSGKKISSVKTSLVETVGSQAPHCDNAVIKMFKVQRWDDRADRRE